MYFVFNCHLAFCYCSKTTAPDTNIQVFWLSCIDLVFHNTTDVKPLCLTVIKLGAIKLVLSAPLSVQHYYSVRIFPGQEPSSVWVGWVTSDFHQHDPGFDLHNVRTVTVTLGDEKGKVHERWVNLQPNLYPGIKSYICMILCWAGIIPAKD